VALSTDGGGEGSGREAAGKQDASKQRERNRDAGSDDAGSGDAGTAAAPATPAAPAAPAAGEPTAAVSDFYENAASQNTSAAWALATDRARDQLGGYPSFRAGQSSLREISFPTLRTTEQTGDSATVELRSIAVHADRTDRCSGTVDLVRSGGRWLLDHFSIATCRTTSGSAPQSAAGEEGGD
jgi:hypothetical protein